MKVLDCTVTAVVGLALAVASSHASAQATPVTVENPPTSPVNVSGPVTVTNPVLPVEVSNADPIPVTVNPAVTTVVQVSGSDTLLVGEPTGTCEELYIVPAGKRLVVEYVSITARGGTVDSIYRVSIHVANDPQTPVFTLDLPSQFSVSNRSVISSQPVRLYADENSTVSGLISRADSSKETVMRCDVVGYLVDIP